MIVDHKIVTLSQVERIIDAPIPHPEMGASSMSEDNNWAGGTYSKARSLLSVGDFDALSVADAEARKLSALVHDGMEGRRRKRIKDCAGDSVDMGLYLSGDPMCMTDFQKAPTPNRLVNIFVNISASAFVPAKTIAARGAAIFTLIRAIELKGYTTQLKLVSVHSSNGHSVYEIIVKQFGEYLNPAITAFLVTSPMTLRRIIFRLMEENSEEVRQMIGATKFGGYGRPCDIHEALKDYLPSPHVYFPRLRGGESGESKYWYDLGKTALKNCGVSIE